MAQFARPAQRAVAHAVELRGVKRGLHLAAAMLGVTARTCRAIASGETSGATICPMRAQEARLNLITERLRDLAALQAQLESELHDPNVAGVVSRLGVDQ